MFLLTALQPFSQNKQLSQMNKHALKITFRGIEKFKKPAKEQQLRLEELLLFLYPLTYLVLRLKGIGLL